MLPLASTKDKSICEERGEVTTHPLPLRPPLRPLLLERRCLNKEEEKIEEEKKEEEKKEEENKEEKKMNIKMNETK